MISFMIVLGIESSCDETAAAVVKNGNELLSNVVFSSMDLHKVYGGVVPEIAARSHIESIIPVIDQALREAFPNSKTENSTTSRQSVGSDGVQGNNEQRESRTDGTVNESRKQETQQSAESAGSVSSSARKQDSAANDLWENIDAIAVTYGAGLGGSLLVGVTTAKELAILKKKPLNGINHVEAHVYANFLTKTSLAGYKLPTTQPDFPVLALIVSGGHSQLVLFRDHFDYELLGQTRDDAIGEAFDKVAKITGLPYPGGPSISEAAKDGDPEKYPLPKAKLTSKPRPRVVGSDGVQGNNEQRASRTDSTVSESRKQMTQQSAESAGSVSSSARKQDSTANDSRYEFSFSGLKTAVLRLAQKEVGEDHTFPSHKLPERLSRQQTADIAASFQRIAIETVVDKTVLAYEEFQPKSVVIAGGVAANQELRRQLSDRLPIDIEYTDPKLCTDNGAMIASLGCFKVEKDQPTSDPLALQIEPNLSM